MNTTPKRMPVTSELLADYVAGLDVVADGGTMSVQQAEAGETIRRVLNNHEGLVNALKACMIRLVSTDEKLLKATGSGPAGELGEITRAKAVLKSLPNS